MQMDVLDTKSGKLGEDQNKNRPFVPSIVTQKLGVGAMERCPITMCRNSAAVLWRVSENREETAKNRPRTADGDQERQ